MASAKAKTSFLGPLLLLLGLFWVLAAGQGNLSFRYALQYGLTVSASGLIVWGLHSLRGGRRRLFALALLLAGGAFFALQLNYLVADYRWLAGEEALRAMLPGYREQILERITVVSALLLVSCLLGLLWGKLRTRGGSGPKKKGKKHRLRTAPVESSRLVRSLRR